MNFFPKNGIGFEIKHLVASAIWNDDIVEAATNWNKHRPFIYDENDTLSNEIFSWYEVEPIWLGSLNESKGGSISGVFGFAQGIDYIIFDPEEQDTEKWQQFLRFLSDNQIEVVHGGWSQYA